jgi:hypothetical protein
MHAVLYWRTTAAIKVASEIGQFFVIVLFAVALAAVGDTEQVVAQWLHPVASQVALTCRIGQCHLYLSVAPPWLLKWPTTEEHFDAIVNFIINNNHS